MNFLRSFTLFSCVVLSFSVLAFDEEHVRKLEERISEIESFLDEEVLDPSDRPISIGGAVRFQYSYTDWDENNRDRFGDLSFDTFRLNLDGEISNFILSAEYRFYPTSSWHGPHHAWFGRELGENWRALVGIHQVPFGLLPFASHSFWLSGGYYVGLEDDYDMGVKFLYNSDPWDFAFAFYKNEELGNSSNANRYSVDLIDNADGGFAGAQADGNQQSNQFNFRGAYTLDHGEYSSSEIGLSAQWSEVYNTFLSESGAHWASAIHFNGNYRRWNVQFQLTRYEYNQKTPSGLDSDIVTMGAYGSSWGVPKRASLGTFNFAYTLPLESESLDSLTFYLDNTFIDPSSERFSTAWQNTAGCILVSGPIFTYIDIISGKNMIFSGGSFVEGNQGRTTRLNINMGYYF